MSTSFPNQILVVVADGTRATLFKAKKKGQGWNLTKQEELEPVDLDDDGPAGVRPPESSDQETDQATFAKQLAQSLNSRALSNDFEHVALMVDPQTLGQMRQSFHKELESRICIEIAKNAIGMTTEDITSILTTETDVG